MLPAELCGIEYDNEFTEDIFPSWPCPQCRRGSLQSSREAMRCVSSIGPGIDLGLIDRWDDYGVFSAMLICASTDCRNGVAISGNYSNTTPDGVYMKIGHGIQCRIVRKYYIRAMYPAVRLINLPEGLADSIASAVARSFPLYWSDPAACATAIRIAIEETANHIQPRRLGPNGRSVNLAAHLKDLRATHANLAEAFTRIRATVGNSGAHGDRVERSSLLAAYGLLEIELWETFDDPTTRRKSYLDRLDP